MATRSVKRGRVLVVGLGISGLATALRLHKLGWEPVIIERAPARRKGGYFIGLFGTGVASADRLGVLDAIGDRRPSNSTTYEIDRLEHRGKGLSFADLPGDPRMVMRGDVENGLFSALPDDLEIRFSTVPTSIEQDDRGVDVSMTDTNTGATTTERFDLVVGADGMRSTVRRLVFGPHEQLLYPLNYMIGACILSRPVRGWDSHDGLIMAEARRSAWVFPFANHNPGVLFSYRVDDVGPEFRRPAIESLRRAYGPEPAGPVLSQLLDEFAAADEYLFDSVNQVRMDRWHQGRVVLVGDSAWCLTLYSGMGASAGLAGGELLGNMLEKHPDDLKRALGAWEEKLRPFIASLQLDGLKMRQFFTPAGEVQRLVRAATIRLFRTPVAGRVLRWLMGNDRLKTIDIVAQ